MSERSDVIRKLFGDRPCKSCGWGREERGKEKLEIRFEEGKVPWRPRKAGVGSRARNEKSGRSIAGNVFR